MCVSPALPALTPVDMGHRRHDLLYVGMLGRSRLIQVMPLCLEALARENGRLAPELERPCTSATRVAPGEDAPRCNVPLLGAHVDSASIALWTYSASVLAQALAVISIGALADAATSRHRLFVLASCVGGGAAALVLFIPPQSALWMLSALLAIASSVGLGIATVCLNSWLPHLADDSAAVARLSAQGTAAGYAGGVLALVLSLVPVGLLQSTWALQLVVSVAGVAWVALSLLAAQWLPAADEGAAKGAQQTPTIGDGWRALFSILRETRQSFNTSLYLAAWFLLSDGASAQRRGADIAGFATITSTAILFGRTSLGMAPAKLVLVAILAPCAGAISSMLWPRLARRLGLRDSLQSVIVLVLVALVIPAYGLLGMLPVFRRPRPPPFGGLRTEGELFVLAVYFGGAHEGVVAQLTLQRSSARSWRMHELPSRPSSQQIGLAATLLCGRSRTSPPVSSALSSSPLRSRRRAKSDLASRSSRLSCVGRRVMTRLRPSPSCYWLFRCSPRSKEHGPPEWLDRWPGFGSTRVRSTSEIRRAEKEQWTRKQGWTDVDRRFPAPVPRARAAINELLPSSRSGLAGDTGRVGVPHAHQAREPRPRAPRGSRLCGAVQGLHRKYRGASVLRHRPASLQTSRHTRALPTQLGARRDALDFSRLRFSTARARCRDAGGGRGRRCQRRRAAAADRHAGSVNLIRAPSRIPRLLRSSGRFRACGRLSGRPTHRDTGVSVGVEQIEFGVSASVVRLNDRQD